MRIMKDSMRRPERILQEDLKKRGIKKTDSKKEKGISKTSRSS